MFVPMLTSCTSSRVPLSAKVSIIELNELHRSRINNGNGDGGGMNPAFTLGRWYTLNTVSTCFFVQL
jgi:hypothetical protein